MSTPAANGHPAPPVPRDRPEGVAPLSPITPKMALAIDALVQGATMTDAAAIAGVNRRTIFRWRDDARFRAAYDKRLKAEAIVADALLEIIQSPPKGDQRIALRAIEVWSDPARRINLNGVARLEEIRDLVARQEKRRSGGRIAARWRQIVAEREAAGDQRG